MMYNTNSPLEVQNLRLKIEKLIEKHSMVEVVEKKAKTLQQLKYLHTILAYFGLQTGNTLDEVKTCYFKRIVNRDLFVRQKHDDLLGTDREYAVEPVGVETITPSPAMSARWRPSEDIFKWITWEIGPSRITASFKPKFV